MSYVLALNANATPYVPPMKRGQFGAIGEEKKKIHELEKEIERLNQELTKHKTHTDSLCKMIKNFEGVYTSLHEENVTLKATNEGLTLTNTKLTKEKEEIINTNNNTIGIINKLWCEQLVNAMLKNAFFTLYHPEIMMIKNETVNNNFNLFQQKVARLFDIISTGVPFAPFMTTYK